MQKQYQEKDQYWTKKKKQRQCCVPNQDQEQRPNQG